MYKIELKNRLLIIINEFFTEERGNRITSNNMEGFSQKILSILKQCKIEDKEPDPEG